MPNFKNLTLLILKYCQSINQFIDVMKQYTWQVWTNRATAKDTKADEVCTNKCQNKKKQIFDNSTLGCRTLNCEFQDSSCKKAQSVTGAHDTMRNSK